MNKKIVIFIVFVSMLLFTGKVSPASEKNSIAENGAAAQTYNIDGLWTFNIYRTSLGITEVCDATILGGEYKYTFFLNRNWDTGFIGFAGYSTVKVDTIIINIENDINIFEAEVTQMNADSMSGTWKLMNNNAAMEVLESGSLEANRNKQPPSPDFDLRGMWVWSKEEANLHSAWPLIFYGQKNEGKCRCMDVILTGPEGELRIVFEEGDYTVIDNQVKATFQYLCLTQESLLTTTFTGNIVNGNMVEGTTDDGYTSLMLQVAMPGNNPPFGSFETPADGASVSGSIPVTGWALAGKGVEKVKIFLLVDGNRLYIGDALFVEGARPDIESAYPHHPMNTRAGWGYMLLTNFLPGGSNGTYVLEAVAMDYVGNSASLGTKTIYCDNANAVKPFGAIDTPAPGQIVSGKNFKNNGWVLTHPPDSIPGGTSINVYVDGKYLGHPSYGIYRPDIEALFGPEYTNRSAAGGSFTLDTTTFEDGLHTIYWTVRDSGGHEEGIGSRYFFIYNSTTNPDAHPDTAHWIFGKKMYHLFENNPLKAFEFFIKPKSESQEK